MASGKVPKLVIKRNKPKRNLKLPEQIIAESEQESKQSRRYRVTHASLMMKRIKISVRSNAYLLAIGLCAAVVMYGIAASVTAEEPAGNGSEKKPRTTSIGAPEEEGVGIGNTENCVWQRDTKDPSVVIRITTGSGAPKIERFREKIVTSPSPGKILIPLKPKKPKKFKPTDEIDREVRQWSGTVPQ